MKHLHHDRFQAVVKLLSTWAITRREQQRLLARAKGLPPEAGEQDPLDRLSKYQKWMATRAGLLADSLWRQVKVLTDAGVASLAADLSLVAGWPADTSKWAGRTRKFLAFALDVFQHEGRDLVAERDAAKEVLDPVLKTFNLQTDSTIRIFDALGP